MARKPAESKRTSRTDEDALDAALEDSFPASDPPSMTDPQAHLGRKDRKPKSSGKAPRKG